MKARGAELEKKKRNCQVWWCTPLIQVPGRQRQVVLCEIKGYLVHYSTSQASVVT